jgi:hypothetical protein
MTCARSGYAWPAALVSSWVMCPSRSRLARRPASRLAWHDAAAPVPPVQTLRPAGLPVGTGDAVATFGEAVAELSGALADVATARPELSFEQEPAPRRLAPHAMAISAVLSGTGPGAGAEIGGGRFVLLFDPAGQQGWDGSYRIISYVRAELEPEMASDPLINAVGWSWLTEALDTCGAGHRNISGTVTTVATQGFGAKQGEPASTGFELRASWSPEPDADGDLLLTEHLAAWCAVICAAAGLPPLAPGVAALRPARRRRRP